ncbi:MAG: hypothetical protein J6S47_07530 [Eubacteriaceae bacterium]|nr:hypothetical protein [Eubacteriaceae bacterium]MCR4895019.1 hypothetical protein [Eubacteriales bacterium]
MNRGTEYTIKYLATGLVAGILYLLVKSVKTSLADLVTLYDTAVYLFPYFIMSICAPMLAMGALNPILGRSRFMHLEHLSILAAAVLFITLIILSPSRDMIIPRITAVVLGMFADCVIFALIDRPKSDPY